MSKFFIVLNLECIQVHISEARVSTALDKLAYMETLVNDKILQDRCMTESELLLSTPTTSSTPSLSNVKTRQPKRSINVSGPVQPYNDGLKNFWYPVAFSGGLKDDTMVIFCHFVQLYCYFFVSFFLCCLA